MKRRTITASLLAASLLSLTCFGTVSVAADAYPAKPILTIVPFSAGGGNDILLRVMGKYAQKHLGQTLTIDNKPGAGGQIGWTLVAKAKPDGYTIGAASLPSMIMIKELRKNVPFAMDDFDFVAAVQTDPIVWVVKEDSPFKTAADVVKAAKTKVLNVAGDGPQSNVQLQHLLAEKDGGFKTNFVPFNGSGKALTALMGGKVDLCASTLSAADKQLANGLRILVVFSDQKVGNLPTAAEAFGKPIAPVGAAIRGICAPKGLPADAKAKLEAGIKKICEDPEFLAEAKKMKLDIGFKGSKETQAIVNQTSKLVAENKDLF